MLKKLCTLLTALFVLTALHSYARGQDALDAFVDRVAGEGVSEKIVLRVDESLSADGGDVFVISSDGDRPLVTGSSMSAATAGFGWYLNRYAHVNISWNALSVNLSEVKLPLPETPERRECGATLRYYLNYCTLSYSCAFWTEERWMKEIDWMALHGVNMPLMPVGVDAVWRNVLLRLGCTEKEISEFIAGPGFQAWWMMNNLEGWGGPNPRWWYGRQEKLSRDILSRMRSLGMEPVLPGYSGMLPRSFVGKPGYDLTDPGLWSGFPRPAFLLPTSEKFAEVSAIYYDELEKIMGRSRFYSTDPFHEGGNIDGVDIPKAYRNILSGMRSHVPDAVWVLQSWNENPRDEALESLDKGDCIVLDLFSDGNPKWQGGYRGHDFIWCMLPNFGGRTGIHGRLRGTMQGWFAASKAFPGTAVGVGAAPEGIGMDSILYDLLYDLPWMRESECAGWLDEYVRSRYGKNDRDLSAAWHLIAGSALDCRTGQQGTSEPVVCARPGWGITGVSTWSTCEIPYDTDALRSAARLFLGASARFRGNANYEHDLVNVVRQAVTDSTWFLYSNIEKAYKSGDMRRFRSLASGFLDMIGDLDVLLSTAPDFRLDSWTSSARQVCDEVPGTADADRDWMEWNARTLISVWGNRDAAVTLHDYSNREWSGMLSSYALPRWKRFFEAVEKGETVSADEWFDMEYAWTLRKDAGPVPGAYNGVSAGNGIPASSSAPADAAASVFEKYFSPGKFILDSGTEVVSLSGESDGYVSYLQGFLSGDSEVFPSSGGRIILSVDENAGYGAEGFDFVVDSTSIRITGRDRSGVFYGIQHLLRLLPPSVYGHGGIKSPVSINGGLFRTAPKSHYRGVMIDVARAFVDADNLKRQIDLMSMHGINVLHLHLTDNEGWRIEIKSHPELAHEGGYRGGNSRIAGQYGRWNERYGGFYTQEEMKDIISYAEFRGVTIIPEIDLPGHSHAIARVCPEILCGYAPDLDKTAGYDTRDVWCVSREENYRLLDDIIGEMAELFPSPYIHVGGDEVGMDGWLSCSGCSALMKRNGFTDVKQLEDLFMKRVTEIVRSKGKIPMAWWDKDVITDSFTKESIVEAWQDVGACRDALAKGYRTVFMSAWHFYFDMKQGAGDPGQDWGGIIDYRKVYASRPERIGVTEAESANIVGYEGAFWGETHLEHAPESPDYLDFMLYPRVAALGALAWGVALSDEDFSREMESNHYARMAAMGIAFRLPEPDVKWNDGILTASVSDGSDLWYRKNGGKARPYVGAIKTSNPERYEFFARSGSGRSVNVVAPESYERIFPAVHLSSSMPSDDWRPASGVENYERETHFSSAPHDGDSILFSFGSPVRCRKMEVRTGDLHFASGGFTSGYVEVSYDGKHFRKVADLSFSKASFSPERPVRAVRIVCTADGNFRNLTIVQPIVVLK